MVPLEKPSRPDEVTPEEYAERLWTWGELMALREADISEGMEPWDEDRILAEAAERRGGVTHRP